MNNKDKEALYTWIDNDVLSQDEISRFKSMSEQERVIFVTERTWQAACEYVRNEFKFQTPPAVVAYMEMNDKLIKENKKLRDALEFYAKTESWNAVDCDPLYKSVSTVEGVIDHSDIEDTSDGTEIRYGGRKARQALREVGEE